GACGRQGCSLALPSASLISISSAGYTMITADVAAVLGKVRRPGDFFAAGTTELLAPLVEVEGAGPVALPLLPIQARELIGVAEPAPYRALAARLPGSINPLDRGVAGSGEKFEPPANPHPCRNVCLLGFSAP